MSNKYTTLALIKAELRGDADFPTDEEVEWGDATYPTSTQVTTWIEEASREIEVMSGEVFSSVLVSSDYIDYDGSGTLMLENVPVISVNELRYDRSNIHEQYSDWVTLQSGQGKNYLTYDSEGEIVFLNGNYATNVVIPKAGKKRICASYSYGHNTTPLEIQRLTTLMVAKRVITSLINYQTNTEGGEVTVGPITVKDPSTFSLNQIKQLDHDISDLRSRIGTEFKVYRTARVYNV